jgi:DnaK suppressor protein
MIISSDQEPFIVKLRARRAELLAAIGSDHDVDKPVELDQARQGRLSRMDAISQSEMSRATRDRMKVELRRVEAAITRIENRTFGKCCSCGEPIERARLQSDPATPFCLPCLEDMADERGKTDRSRR